MTSDRSLDARAKVNLALHVTGKRDDGYHLLDSLVVFPDIGDRLTVSATPGSGEIHLTVSGPFSDAIDGDAEDNLIITAVRKFGASLAVKPKTDLHFRLEKNLPVASGIGGGSADAAAALKLAADCWSEGQEGDDLAAIGLGIGADVPVCLKSPRPCRMRGIGEQLSDAPPVPALGIVLVNPGVAVPTGPVFKALAGHYGDGLPELPANWKGLDQLVRWLSQCRNDLEEPAINLVPEIARTLTLLRAQDHVLFARMSGSGATVFALTPDRSSASAVADAIRARQPDWWVQVGS